MQWQLASLLSCILFAISALFGARASVLQGGTLTLVCYYTTTCITAALFASWKLRVSDIEYANTESVLSACAAGFLAACAVTLQFKMLAKFPKEMPWIILIGALYPALIILVSLVLGEMPTPRQWVGIILAIAAIVLICVPAKAG